MALLVDNYFLPLVDNTVLPPFVKNEKLATSALSGRVVLSSSDIYLYIYDYIAYLILNKFTGKQIKRLYSTYCTL